MNRCGYEGEEASGRVAIVFREHAWRDYAAEETDGRGVEAGDDLTAVKSATAREDRVYASKTNPSAGDFAMAGTRRRGSGRRSSVGIGGEGGLGETDSV